VRQKKGGRGGCARRVRPTTTSGIEARGWEGGREGWRDTDLSVELVPSERHNRALMTALHEFVFILAPFLLFLPALLAGFAPRRGGAGEDRQEEKWEGRSQTNVRGRGKVAQPSHSLPFSSPPSRPLHPYPCSAFSPPSMRTGSSGSMMSTSHISIPGLNVPTAAKEPRSLCGAPKVVMRCGEERLIREPTNPVMADILYFASLHLIPRTSLPPVPARAGSGPRLHRGGRRGGRYRGGCRASPCPPHRHGPPGPSAPRLIVQERGEGKEDGAGREGEGRQVRQSVRCLIRHRPRRDRASPIPWLAPYILRFSTRTYLRYHLLLHPPLCPLFAALPSVFATRTTASVDLIMWSSMSSLSSSSSSLSSIPRRNALAGKAPASSFLC